MAKVLLTIIVNCRLHLSVSGSLIAKVTGQDSHHCLYCNLLTMSLRYRKDKTALHITKKKKKEM